VPAKAARPRKQWPTTIAGGIVSGGPSSANVLRDRAMLERAERRINDANPSHDWTADLGWCAQCQSENYAQRPVR
jgi:hypothetical protein